MRVHGVEPQNSCSSWGVEENLVANHASRGFVGLPSTNPHVWFAALDHGRVGIPITAHGP